MKKVLNFVLFQVGWFACAIGAGENYPFILNLFQMRVERIYMIFKKNWQYDSLDASS